jgi:hypothetical protein
LDPLSRARRRNHEHAHQFPSVNCLRPLHSPLRAAERNLWVWPLSSAYLGTPTFQRLMLGFGVVATRTFSPPDVRCVKRLLVSQRSQQIQSVHLSRAQPAASSSP